MPQVARRLTSRSPDFARWASVFRPERCLSSRKRPKSGGSSPEPAAFWPGRAAFPRGRRTCPAAFVQLGHGSRSEEHTSELKSLMRTPYVLLSLKKKQQHYIAI